jgi:hypothetical protein
MPTTLPAAGAGQPEVSSASATPPPATLINVRGTALLPGDARDRALEPNPVALDRVGIKPGELQGLCRQLGQPARDPLEPEESVRG